MVERAGERGSAVVEFALVLPVLILVVLALAEVTAVARVQLELTHAAREGARVAATAPDPNATIAAVQSIVGSEAVAVSVERPSVVGRLARVTVELPYRLPVIGVSVELRAVSSMRVEQ